MGLTNFESRLILQSFCISQMPSACDFREVNTVNGHLQRLQICRSVLLLLDDCR